MIFADEVNSFGINFSRTASQPRNKRNVISDGINFSRTASQPRNKRDNIFYIKTLDYLKKALIYGRTSRISS